MARSIPQIAMTARMGMAFLPIELTQNGMQVTVEPPLGMAKATIVPMPFEKSLSRV